MALKPLELPKPPGLGYVGDLPIRQTNPQLPKVDDPVYLLNQMQKQQPTMPDIVQVRYGAGDKATVGKLLQAANGQESGLTGVSSTYAATLLKSWGYPTTADAWSADQWKQALDGNAAMMNPMGSLLGDY